MEEKELEQALEHDAARKIAEAQTAALPGKQSKEGVIETPDINAFVLELEKRQVALAKDITGNLLMVANQYLSKVPAAARPADGKNGAPNREKDLVYAKGCLDLVDKILRLSMDFDILADRAYVRLIDNSGKK